AASLIIGTTGIGWQKYWTMANEATVDGNKPAHPIRAFCDTMLKLPVPRLIMGSIAGAALAMAGAMFQALFRNPLASPYTLGISSGASLGAAITIVLTGGGLWFGVLPKVSVAAFAGALACVLIVYAVAHLRRGASMAVLLLTGITIGYVCSALIVFVMFLANTYDLSAILHWMMGSLEAAGGVGMNPVYESLMLVVVAAGVAIYLHRDLDLLMMGETLAASRGVPVRQSRRWAYFSASLLTAGVVAHCGPIGFVGLIVPHVMRSIVGPTHRWLLPGCALAGAMFLPLCDLLARNAMWWLRGEPRQVPVGVLTNLVGGLFFLYILLVRRNDRPLT
ncbi:MAG: iron ABC transporter permease, partial [Phycisphaerae bacterium]|nr:iron ABC transporter permease [Phycisphaerae bacterium]